MHEIIKNTHEKRLDSFSLFIGTGKCNANCEHCAGMPLRKYAPVQDGIIDRDLFYETIKNCYSNGARYLSLSSSGEPTLSPLAVTKTFELIKECEKEGIKFSPINLYSNGIRIGEDEEFCKQYLPIWKRYGLTSFYITVHNINENKNAEIYRVNSYPSLERILSRIHDADLVVRGNLVLSKKTVHTSEDFISTVKKMENIGFDSISAWSVRGMDDKIDYMQAPSEEELDKMEDWINYKNSKIKIKLLREKDRARYEKGEKLTLFPNGILSNSWCN